MTVAVKRKVQPFNFFVFLPWVCYITAKTRGVRSVWAQCRLITMSLKKWLKPLKSFLHAIIIKTHCLLSDTNRNKGKPGIPEPAALASVGEQRAPQQQQQQQQWRGKKPLIYNQWQLKPMKFLKECDCCQKELGTTMLRSALVPLKAVAEGLWESCWKAGGHRPARKWILHTVRIIAQFRAVILNLWSTNCASWNRQPSFMSSCFLLSCCKQALLWAVSLPLSAYEDHTDRPHQQP